MSIYKKQRQGDSRTKLSGNGKKRTKFRGKRMYNAGSYFTATKSGDKNVTKRVRHRGGRTSHILQRAGVANLLTDNGYVKATIKNVVESKDNRNFARLNIITKGTIIETDRGRAVVINRPARSGAINARLLK